MTISEHDAKPRAGIAVGDLTVAEPLWSFVNDEALPGTGVEPTAFWNGLSDLVNGFRERNRALLATRDRLQSQIDDWHLAHAGRPHDAAAYRTFLEEIGYLVPEGEPFTVETPGVDHEIAHVAGPQLVVPLSNARYTLNAVNARWGSLYDALYATDALGDTAPPGPYDPARGRRVIEWTRAFLDEVVPLTTGSHADAVAYTVASGELMVALRDGSTSLLRHTDRFAGYRGNPDAPTAVLLEQNGLAVELVVDRAHPVGADDAAGIADVLLEAAVTTIVDCEDSITAVDADDKVAAYRNWLGLMRGDLTEQVTKDGRTFTRVLADDRHHLAPDGSPVSRRGRALLLVRNVGHLMTTPAVADRDGEEAFEGLVDAAVTVLCALHDVRGPRANSPEGSVYVVKPKLHGPAEVAFTVEVMAHVEQFLGLPPDTVKIGLMDEERRTSANLLECIRPARRRLAFVNTGFLDRTGDEVHTSMRAGPMVRKADMKAQPWIRAYEERNVAVALACGLPGRAQVGKGMWAAPDLMAAMLAEKVGHLEAGASCAWVPSPTAATLHATHYHRVDVWSRQRALAATPTAWTLDDLLTLPVAEGTPWTAEEVQAELDNDAQGILGYVVRWVDLGIGCSKVPDIHGIGLMEDRATCRISSQLIANWLLHGVVDADQVRTTMERMAVVVDGQSADVEGYRPMAPAFDGPAFRAACALALEGTTQPSGYTEPILHAHRAERKRLDAASDPTPGGNP
ncbi:MAG: malate synthase G [Acidimicrobiia bacterium]